MWGAKVDSLEVLGDKDPLPFPPVLEEPLVAITGYERVFLNLEEKMIIRILQEFEVMDSREVIILWLGGDKHLATYLGKLIRFPFAGILR